MGNDDNGAVCNTNDIPGSSSLNSAAVISNLQANVVYAMVGAYSQPSATGVNYGYAFQYVGGNAPPGTPSITPSPVSFSGTPPASMSNTVPPSTTPSSTASGTPASTPDGTPSNLPTPTQTPSNEGTLSPSRSYSRTGVPTSPPNT